jgi:phosphotransacetylase
MDTMTMAQIKPVKSVIMLARFVSILISVSNVIFLPIEGIYLIADVYVQEEPSMIESILFVNLVLTLVFLANL